MSKLGWNVLCVFLNILEHIKFRFSLEKHKHRPPRDIDYSYWDKVVNFTLILQRKFLIYTRMNEWKKKTFLLSERRKSKSIFNATGKKIKDAIIKIRSILEYTTFLLSILSISERVHLLFVQRIKIANSKI